MISKITGASARLMHAVLRVNLSIFIRNQGIRCGLWAIGVAWLRIIQGFFALLLASQSVVTQLVKLWCENDRNETIIPNGY